MLEDADFEVTYDPPDLSSTEPVAVDLLLTDIQLQGVDEVEAVIRRFQDRHADLPVTIRARHAG
jgi:CheY-like chemotaxis protein